MFPKADVLFAGTAPVGGLLGDVWSIPISAGFVGQHWQNSLLNPLVPSDLARLGRSQKESMPERWLSVDEIAAHLGVNPDTIYKWITRKRMPAHKVGKLWKFLASEIDGWVKGGLAGDESSGGEAKSPAKGKKPPKP